MDMKKYNKQVSDSIANSITDKFSSSNLIKDGMPSFYISIDKMPCCTHRMSKTDIPVWCANGSDSMKAMDLINKLKL